MRDFATVEALDELRERSHRVQELAAKSHLPEAAETPSVQFAFSCTAKGGSASPDELADDSRTGHDCVVHGAARRLLCEHACLRPELADMHRPPIARASVSEPSPVKRLQFIEHFRVPLTRFDRAH